MQETYIPLYRKYRPQKFADLIGQENLVNILSNAIKLDKIAHAYLFCGPRGTGKTSSARILAKSLNCVNGPTTEPCGVCPSCINITNSTPVDVIEIDGASNRGVEHAQAILEKIQYAPVDGKFKIYIIDEVHMLSNQAFNALLKTIEEPPKNVIFIFATTEIHKVLDTIISRCQRFDFRRITTDDIVKRLEFIAKEENIKITKDALYNIAKSSKGGMRDSLALLDQVSILGLTNEIQSSDIDNILGKISIEELFEIVENFKDENAQNALLNVNKLYEKGSEPAQIISNIIQYLRDLLIIKNTNDDKVILEISKLNEQNIKLLRPQAEQFENEVIIYMLDRLMYYLKEIKDTSNRQLFMELATVELANNQKYYSYNELIKKVQDLELRLQNGGAANISSMPVNLPKPKIFAEKVQEVKKAEPVETIQKNEIAEHIKEEKPEQVLPKIEEEKVVEEPIATTPVIQENPVVIEEPQPKIENLTKVENVEQKNTTQNVNGGDWNELLNNIESTPSRMFFNSLGKPMEINSEKIVIGFTKDVFIKQAKDDSKRIPLENAAKKYFNVSSITVEIKQFDASAVVVSQAPKTEKIVEAPKQTTPQVEETENIDDGYYDNLLEQKSNEMKSFEHSDGSKMVQELFNGKYL
ncbi:DNA polymerase III subunit gamma/tau [bacterium]|nr:DNA polymerase III subunit gamma/tau [bacterium]